MVGIVVALSVMLAILIIYFILEKRELAQLKTEIKELMNNESNQKLHSRSGLIDEEFINEINQLLEEVNDNRIHFNRKNHEIEQMMTNISHDLRTPLTSALGYIDMIAHSDMSDDEKTEALYIVELRLKRLKELIDSFFEFSMVISRDEKPEMTEMNLVAVLEEAIAHSYDDYCERGRIIELDCKSNMLKIYSNRNMMIRIFDNLIVNALKHGQGNLHIIVDTCNDGKEINITFINRILDEDLDVNRLFEEFYTTEISRTRGNTGLGLAIVKQFSQIIGWSISAEEKDNNLLIMIKIPQN